MVFENNKSILFVCAGFGGGIGKMIRFVSGLSVGLFENVYLLHRNRESINDLPPDGVRELNMDRVDRTSVLWRIQEIRSIRSTIKLYKPDIVCCFGSEISVMVTVAMICQKHTKLILCDRGDPYTLSFPWKCLCRLAFSHADSCVFQLEKQGQWYGTKVMKKSTVIPNAFLPTGEILPCRANPRKIITSVGRFVYEKRYDVLIQAFSLVHELHPDYRLVLYGDGPYREFYTKLIYSLNLQNYVEMPGYVSDPMDKIRDASVFVLSSLYEGMPNTLIEALALGVPTVSTDCNPGGPDFLTDHGYRGLIVPVNDVDAMFKSICQIIEDPQLAKELSERGPEIISILNKDKIASMWENFFQQIINNYA